MGLGHAPPVQLRVDCLQGMLTIQVHQHPSSLRPVVRGCLEDLAGTPRPSQQSSNEGVRGMPLSLPLGMYCKAVVVVYALQTAFPCTFTL